MYGPFAAEDLLLQFLEFFGGVGEIFSPIAVRTQDGYRVDLDSSATRWPNINLICKCEIL